MKIIEIDAEQMRIAAAGVTPLPVEQSASWDRFETASGRKPWKRLAWVDSDGKNVAIIALTRYDVRRFPYLWAKKGPVWLKSATPEREIEFRADLREYVRKHAPEIVFVRMGCWWDAPDITTPLQSITYDRTIVINTCDGNADAVLETFSKEGRRSIRRAQKKLKAEGAKVVELTGLSFEEFKPLYAILEETAQRGGFRPNPIETYWNMLQALGPQHARLFGIVHDGEVVAWDLILVNDNAAAAYYGASSAKSRKVLATDNLDFETALILGREGIKTLDLMGIDSPRVSSLHGVGIYKRRYAHHYSDVPAAYDMPTQPALYKALTAALNAKRTLASLPKRAKRELPHVAKQAPSSIRRALTATWATLRAVLGK